MPNPRYSVQVTVEQFIIEGQYKDNCLFAGLAVYERFREDLLFCSNRSFWTSKSITRRHVIPASNKLYLILYAIRNYTTVTASFTFTLSECVGIMINPCEYEAYCRGKSGNPEVCQSYLSSLSTRSLKLEITVRDIVWLQTLHSVNYETAATLSLTQSVNSCGHLYISSAVKAKRPEIFQDIFHHFFLEPICRLVIYPKIHTSADVSMDQFSSYRSYLGHITRLEWLHITGTGRLTTKEYDQYALKEESELEIAIKEVDFNTRYAVSMKADAMFNIGTMSENAIGVQSTFNEAFILKNGGSNSSVILTFMVYPLNILRSQGILSSLSDWEITNMNKKAYIVPLQMINTDKKSNKLDALSKFKSLPFAYLLQVKLKGDEILFKRRGLQVGTLQIQSRFCILKCIVSARWILDLNECNTLLDSDKSDTKGLFRTNL